jgi:hypothetical protein
LKAGGRRVIILANSMIRIARLGSDASSSEAATGEVVFGVSGRCYLVHWLGGGAVGEQRSRVFEFQRVREVFEEVEEVNGGSGGHSHGFRWRGGLYELSGYDEGGKLSSRDEV